MARAERGAVVWDRPELRALCPAGARRLRRHATAMSRAGGSRFRWRGIDVSLAGPGRPQRRQRRRRADRVPRSREPIPPRPPPRWPTFAALDGGSSCSGRTATECPSTTTTPTIRPRSRPRSRRRRTLARRGWSPSSSRTCTRARGRSRASFGARAGGRRRRRRARGLPGSRARRGLPGRRRAPGRGGRGRRRGRTDGRVDAVVRRRPRGSCRATLRAGDLCLVMGAGDVDALGRGRSWREPPDPPDRDLRWPAMPPRALRGFRARLPARPSDDDPHRRRGRAVRAPGHARETSSGCSPGPTPSGLEVGVVGSGSNLLVADSGVRGLVLKLDKELSTIELRRNARFAAAAARGCRRCPRGRPRPG